MPIPRLLVFLFLLGLAAGVTAHFPARLAWSLLAPEALQQHVPASQVGGTVWQGHADVAVQQRPLTITWQAGWTGVGWTARTAGLLAEGSLSGRPGTRLMTVRIRRASLAPRLLAPLLPPGLVVEGDLLLHDVVLSRSAEGLMDASGRLAWGPGRVQPAGRGSINVPALSGELVVERGVLVVDVDSERAPGQPIARLHLDPPTREAGVAVRQRALDQLGLPGAGKQSPETVVFSVRQVL